MALVARTPHSLSSHGVQSMRGTHSYHKSIIFRELFCSIHGNILQPRQLGYKKSDRHCRLYIIHAMVCSTRARGGSAVWRQRTQRCVDGCVFHCFAATYVYRGWRDCLEPYMTLKHNVTPGDNLGCYLKKILRTHTVYIMRCHRQWKGMCGRKTIRNTAHHLYSSCHTLKLGITDAPYTLYS